MWASAKRQLTRHADWIGTRYSKMKQTQPWNPLNALIGKTLNKKIKQLSPEKTLIKAENSESVLWEDLLGRK